MKTHIFVSNGVSRFALAAALLLALTAGCGGNGAAPPPLDQDAPVAEQREWLAQHARGSRAAQRFAPELLTAAQTLLERAGESRTEAEARALIARADAYLRNAALAAEAIQRGRTIAFPEGRSFGDLQARSWDGGSWRGLGPAQGRVSVPAEEMVMLSAAKDLTNDDLAAIAALPPGAIQNLNLGLTEVTTDGLAVLEHWPGLRDLSLAESLYDDEAMPHLGRCLALRHLNLLQAHITDRGIEHLRGLPALEELALGDNARLSDTALLHIAELPRLRTLILRGVEISDVGVDYLARAQGLKRLWIGAPMVTDEAVPLLARHRGLEELVLLQTSISPSGMRALRRALPQTAVNTTS